MCILYDKTMTQSSLLNDESKNSAFDEAIEDSDEELEEFDPIPYVFKLKDVFGNSLKLRSEQIQNARTVCPPFHTLLDHTVSILWILYSQKGHDKLNASNVHWALKFLEGVKEKQGNYSPDVAIAIDHLQVALLDIYASIDEKSIAKMNLESTRLTKDDKDKDKPQSEDTKSGYGEFAGGILGLHSTKVKKTITEKNKLPSLILSDMISNLDLEEIENLFLKDDERVTEVPQEQEQESDSETKKKKSSGEQITDDNAPDDEEEIFPEKWIHWRDQHVQNAIRQLEQIRDLDDAFKTLKCKGNADAIDKLRKLIEKT